MPVYSHSRFSSYENCPMQYRLRYVDQIEVERRESVEAFLGQRVHGVLQLLHERLLDGIVLTESELLAALRADWRREWRAGILIVRVDRTAEEYQRTAERCLVNYYRANVPPASEGFASLPAWMRSAGERSSALFSLAPRSSIRIVRSGD